MKYFSVSHRKFIEALLKRIADWYGANLRSLAVFGSYARGENRMDSDLDLLIVLKTIPEGEKVKRQEDFVRNVEMPLSERQATCEKDGVRLDISSLILSQKEASNFLPLYLDMVDHHMLVVDHEDFLRGVLDRTREKMQRWGSQKKEIGGHWYWEIRPGLKWSEIIDYDK